ncbi:MAG TPA: Asp-tRNA(Asn)/Glu-tRNA(Gln) amidotransferase subunit GatA [Blastocatellia bacterium]|nr:Asp-tRNA(Asn)/Glu-tRNA(Gln) amidotransferase subunit GatA [Blastocatellia bacterium]
MSDSATNTIAGLHSAYAAGTTTARAEVERRLALIDQLNPSLNAFLTVTSELALAQADASDARRAAGEPTRPLDGIPIALKDNMVVTGVRTTCGSRILSNYLPPYTATVVERLVEAGAVVLGKTNCDEFAMGSSNENSAYGPVRNPLDTSRVPGGSSGGSAAAVSAGMAVAALGSDTGGSIRQPASLCGIVGMKPTYGRVSRYGLVAFGSSLDQIGPFATTVADAARMLSVIAGRDPMDSTSSEAPVPDYENGLDNALAGVRVGVPSEFFGDGLDAGTRELVESAIQRLRDDGAEIVDVSLPHMRYSTATYYIVATAEASSNLARFDGVRYGFRAEEADELRAMYNRTRAQGFGAEVKRRIMLGTYVLSSGYYDAYYDKALRVRTLIERDFSTAFQRCDVIATPASPTVAFPLGAKTADPLQMYLSDIYTITANLAGVPGISVPCGTSEGLPVGLQLLAPHFGEVQMLRAARAVERATPA